MAKNKEQNEETIDELAAQASNVRIPHAGGRPSSYTKELSDKICQELAMGKSIRTVCASDEMPSVATIFNWMRAHPEFLEQYARAKQEAADAMAEDILTIAEVTVDMVQQNPTVAGPMVQAQRLHIDTKKWLMSKLQPKKYGDKLDVTSDGKQLPAPITQFNGIPRNNSNTEGGGTQQED
jgi:hypothetical protein